MNKAWGGENGGCLRLLWLFRRGHTTPWGQQRNRKFGRNSSHLHTFFIASALLSGRAERLFAGLIIPFDNNLQISKYSPTKPEALPSTPDGTLALDVHDYLRHKILRRYRNHHMHMSRHQIPLLDPTFVLFHQSAKHLSKMLSQLHTASSCATSYGLGFCICPFCLPLSCA